GLRLFLAGRKAGVDGAVLFTFGSEHFRTPVMIFGLTKLAACLGEPRLAQLGIGFPVGAPEPCVRLPASRLLDQSLGFPDVGGSLVEIAELKIGGHDVPLDGEKKPSAGCRHRSPSVDVLCEFEQQLKRLPWLAGSQVLDRQPLPDTAELGWLNRIIGQLYGLLAIGQRAAEFAKRAARDA